MKLGELPYHLPFIYKIYPYGLLPLISYAMTSMCVTPLQLFNSHYIKIHTAAITPW